MTKTLSYQHIGKKEKKKRSVKQVSKPYIQAHTTTTQKRKLDRMFRRVGLRLAEFKYVPLVSKVSHKETKYRLLSKEHVSVVKPGAGLPEMLKVEPEALTLLTAAAFDDIEHLLRPSHLACLRKIFDDPEASDNDKFVALQLLKNANIAASRVLPGCQDTGTAIIAGYRGEQVFVPGNDEEALSRGVF